MKTLFADTSYWIALSNPRDNLHDMAVNVSASQQPCLILTTEMVLAEFLNTFADKGRQLRQKAVEVTEALLVDPNVTVEPQTSALFREALRTYRQRLDKEWGATDCASFVIMERHEIHDALTHDKHFAQAGFRPLLRDDA